MPPPKGKFGTSIGKPPRVTNTELDQSDTSTSSSILTTEMEQQLETELCWCIQQLQTALKSGKLNNKQIQEHTKALNTLMSSTAPIIKKRQVMRLSFGDYRAKMSAEEKKSSKSALKMKVNPAVPSKKSIFVKKSTFACSENTFKFNFGNTNNDLSSDIGNIKIESAISQPQKEERDIGFVPSNNSFRFSFDINESEKP